MATKEPDIEKETPVGEPRAKLTCSICLDAYKEPKVLPCCHTFCRVCLEGLVTAKTDSAGGKRESVSEHGDQPEDCPKPDFSLACDAESSGEGVRVYEGYEVGESAVASTEEYPTYAVPYSSAERSYKSERDPELCDGCGGIAAPETPVAEGAGEEGETQEDVGVCREYKARDMDAKEKLRCPECRTEHDVPKQGVEGFLTDFSLVADICRAPTCQCLVCIHCIVEKHQGHKLGPINDKTRREVEGKLTELKEQAEAQMTSFEQHMRHIESVERLVSGRPEKVKQAINTAIDANIALLESRRKSLLEKVESRHEADMKISAELRPELCRYL